MKRFLKDNLILFIVLTVALLGALALLVFTVIEHDRMNRYYAQAGELRSDIAKLIKQSPAPVSGNIEPIKTRTAEIIANTAKLQQYYGKTRQTAVDAFTAKLGVKTNEFKEKFRESWEADSNRNSLGGRDRFYQRFKRQYDKWDDALEVFSKEYQKCIVEKINDSNVDAILMAALGVPRNLNGDSERAMRYMWQMRAALVDIFTKANPDFRFYGDAASFSFDFKHNPTPTQIPAIVKNWGIIADLCNRISKVKLQSMSSFVNRNIDGEASGKYKIYHYTFTVNASLAKIRELTKIINDAYKDHHFYIVRSIFLYAENDGAGKVFRDRSEEAERLRLELEESEDEKSKDEKKDLTRAASRNLENMLNDGRNKKIEAAPKIDVSTLPMEKRPGYGKILFGGDSSYEAVFDVEYVVLTEPELN